MFDEVASATAVNKLVTNNHSRAGPPHHSSAAQRAMLASRAAYAGLTAVAAAATGVISAACACACARDRPNLHSAGACMVQAI